MDKVGGRGGGGEWRGRSGKGSGIMTIAMLE